jgi:hypothetical protein
MKAYNKTKLMFDGGNLHYKVFDCETIPLINLKYENKKVSLNFEGFEDFKMPDYINHLCIEFTDDPTSYKPGGVISLGYYVLRMVFKNLKRVGDWYETKFLNGFSFQISRPARRTLTPRFEAGFKYEVKPLILSFENDFLLSMRFPKNHSKDWFFVWSFPQKRLQKVEQINPMSLFQPVKSKTNLLKPVEDVVKSHENLVKEVFECTL